MVVVHPAFDPTTKTWFTDDGAEAESLCKLKQKIPGVKIVGYYPHGAPPICREPEQKKLSQIGLGSSNYRGPKRQLKARQTLARLASQKKLELPEPPDDPPSRIDKLAEALVKSGQIQRSTVKLDKPKPKKVLSALQARQTLPHRPRQKVKQDLLAWDVRPKSSWSDEDDAKLKSMAMQGLSAGVIGKELKVTRNAVIGRANRIGIRLGRVR